MGTRFTRISVVAANRRLDVSLPADVPLSEQFPVILRLLSVPTEHRPVRWALSSPESGALNVRRSLDDLGVLDGRVLHLTEAEAAAQTPLVDDVEVAIADRIDDIAPPFVGETRRSGVAALLALVLTVALAALWPAADQPAAWAAGIGIGLAALILGAGVRTRTGWWLAGLVAPAFALSALGLPFDGLLAPIAAVLAAALGLLIAAVLRRSAVVVAGAVVVSVLLWVAVLLAALDLAGGPAAGLLLVLAMAAVSFAGPVGLAVSQLVVLLVADERGEPVERAAVLAGAGRGTAVVTGVTAGASVIAGLSILVMVFGAQPPAAYPDLDWLVVLAGVWGGLAFALRSRRFSRAGQILPMLAVGALGGVAGALTLPARLGSTGAAEIGLGMGLVAVLVVVLAVVGFGSLREVAAARTQRLLDIVEPMAVALLVPLVALSFGILPAVVDLVS